MILKNVTVDELNIDISSLDRNDQGELFQELLEVVPDAELANCFILHATSELEDLLKEHFMNTYGLVEASDGEADEKIQP